MIYTKAIESLYAKEIYPINSKQYTLRIKDMSLGDRPKEKLISQGPDILSITELLAIILNTGTPNEDVLSLSSRIIREYGEKAVVSEKDPQKMSAELNIPIHKACQIVAIGELGRRFFEKKDIGLAIIRNASDVYEYLRELRHLPKEHLRGLYLNNHHRVIHDESISIGTIDTNVVHARDVFRPAIEYNAVAIVLAHNHPSNVAMPSNEDIEVTKQLISAGKLIGIPVLDHVIITQDTFVSIEAKYA